MYKPESNRVNNARLCCIGIEVLSRSLRVDLRKSDTCYGFDGYHGTVKCPEISRTRHLRKDGLEQRPRINNRRHKLYGGFLVPRNDYVITG